MVGLSEGSGSPRSRNLLLGRLPIADEARLLRELTPVDLPVGLILHTGTGTQEHVYFPLSGIVSTLATTRDGESVEVSILGREGMAGWCGLMGEGALSHTWIMQHSGTGLRGRLAVFQQEFLRGKAFARSMHSFFYLQITQISQSVICNRLHSTDQRLARWLVATADLLERDQLQLTQEFLSEMLGSQRSTVTVAAGEMQRRGLIDYSRGNVRIRNRVELEAMACECYGLVRSVYQRVLRPDVPQR